MSGLPPGFDAWHERIPEGIDEPMKGDIMDSYSCIECGGDFTQHDINTANYHMEFDDDINNWAIKHVDCNREELA